MRDTLWVLAGVFAAIAGFTDWRWRRIPNWLTVPGVLAGIAANAAVEGWGGVKTALLGALLGLALLLPLVLVRSLGAGDWKLAGAVGGFIGPERLIAVLVGTIVVAGLMAIVLIVIKKRVGETARNIARMLGALLRLRVPPAEVSLDNPRSLKVPFGLAMAVTVVAAATMHLVKAG